MKSVILVAYFFAAAFFRDGRDARARSVFRLEPSGR